MGLVDHFLESTVGVYSPLLTLITTENIIDTIWKRSTKILFFSKHKDKIILFSEYDQFIDVYLLLFVDGEINHLLRKIYPSHHPNKLI